MRIFTATVLSVGLLIGAIEASDLIGCKYDDSLCEVEEVCVDDNLFGRCQSSPLDPYKYQLDGDAEVGLYQQLVALVGGGFEWKSPESQCVLRYFALTQRLNLPFDRRFCQVRKPENLLVLLSAVETEMAASVPETPEKFVAEEFQPRQADDTQDNQVLTNLLGQLVSTLDNRAGDPKFRQERVNNQESPGYVVEEFEDLPNPSSINLSPEEEMKVEQLLVQVKNNQMPDLTALNDVELDKFIKYLGLLQMSLSGKVGMTEGEVAPDELILPGQFDDGKFLDKKDEEILGFIDQGTGNVEHRIQTREPILEGLYPRATTLSPLGAKFAQGGNNPALRFNNDRVYLQLDQDLSDSPDGAIALVRYIEKLLKLPAGVFTDIDVNGREVSFSLKKLQRASPEEPAFNSSQIASLITMKHKKAIQDKMNLHLNKVGSGQPSQNDVVVTEANGGDGFVVPTLIICGAVVGLLVVVLGAYVIRSRSATRKAIQKLANVGDIESRPSKDYEELCRQRMGGKSGKPEPLSGIVGALQQRLGSQSEPSPASPQGSKGSSVSSWSEEPVQTNMDISTGHMILSYMEEHLTDKNLLGKEWSDLEAYEPDLHDVGEAERPENVIKNRYQDILPYDHTRVVLTESGNQRHSDYINASTICDSDPRAPAYIATQGPLMETAADFWQLVWEQGAVVIVNLTKLSEDSEVKCFRYWPESGAEVFNNFEIHLVSEHIWCEDYLVRSFYLKNLKTNETRTVTQFHFLTWPDKGVPLASKPLLEFRRKVNKSYKGRSCPVIVHCSDGVGRTGTYCLLDMVLHRINKGVKEINIAATLEHIRDQRMRMVMTKEQFEFVLVSVAEEVQAILKALAQQQ